MRAFYSLNPDLRCIVLGPVSSCEAKSGAEGKSVEVCIWLVGNCLPASAGMWVSSRTGCTQQWLPETFINLLLISYPLIGFFPHLKEKVNWILHEVFIGISIGGIFVLQLLRATWHPSQFPWFQEAKIQIPLQGFMGHWPRSSFSPFLSWGHPCVCCQVG